MVLFELILIYLRFWIHPLHIGQCTIDADAQSVPACSASGHGSYATMSKMLNVIVWALM